jgi:hypothetical protein
MHKADILPDTAKREKKKNWLQQAEGITHVWGKCRGNHLFYSLL